MYSSGDMEISCGQPLTITGRVHSNGQLYIEPSSTLTFQSDVTAVGCRTDDRMLRRADETRGIEHLVGWRDVVARSAKQIERAADRFQIEPLAERDEFALGEPVVLEQLLHGLQIETAGKVERVFVPALELRKARLT